MQHSAHAQNLGAFINLESTGPAGPDFLFQSSGEHPPTPPACAWCTQQLFGAGQLQLFSGMQCALPAPCCLGMLCEHGDRPLQLLLYPLDFVAVSAV